MKVTRFLIFVFLTISSISFAELREGKAVYEIAEEGMKITAAGLKNIEVETEKISSVFSIVIPSKSLVLFQDKIGVYRLRDDWFKLITVKIVKKSGGELVIEGDFKEGDSIAIKGGDLLRVSEMDALGGGE